MIEQLLHGNLWSKQIKLKSVSNIYAVRIKFTNSTFEKNDNSLIEYVRIVVYVLMHGILSFCIMGSIEENLIIKCIWILHASNNAPEDTVITMYLNVF